MKFQGKTKEVLITELLELRSKYDSLKASYEKDLTDRKNSEEEMQKSEEHFKLVVSNLPDGIIVLHDHEYRYIFAEGMGLADIGLSREMLIGKKPSDLFSKVFSDQLEQKIGEAFKGIKETFEIKLGNDIFTETVIPVKDKSNKIVAVIGIINNITDLKKAEETITVLAHAIRSISECVSITDMEDNILFVNKALLKTYKYEEQELIGKPISIIRSPKNSSDIVHQILPATLQGGWNGELLNRRKDGTEFPVFISTSVIRDDRDNPIALIGIANDITAHKQAEQAKAEAESSYRKMIENAPLGMHFYKSENGKLIFVGANPAANKMLGVDHLQFIGKSIEEAFPPLIQTEIPDRYREAAEKGIVWATEQISYADEKIAGAYEVKAFQTIPGNMVAIFSDISERKKAEQELILAKEHAEKSDRLKSAFLTNMSHEIRTPMNGILGFSELLKEHKLDGERQQEYISIIQKSGVRMLNIINDIIDISKIEAGLINVEIKESDINEHIEFIYSFFKPEVEAKGIKLSFRNSLPAEEAIIKTDNEKLYAILTNLVKNSIKYTNEGSIDFGYVKKADRLEFYVKDTGIGIPEDRQEAIFERFIQADINDKMARQGAGLGLSISKAFVELLGGKIWVESKEGIGSTFYFTLPYNT